MMLDCVSHLRIAMVAPGALTTSPDARPNENRTVTVGKIQR
jgi:hypothetical protein